MHDVSTIFDRIILKCGLFWSRLHFAVESFFSGSYQKKYMKSENPKILKSGKSQGLEELIATLHRFSDAARRLCVWARERGLLFRNCTKFIDRKFLQRQNKITRNFGQVSGLSFLKQKLIAGFFFLFFFILFYLFIPLFSLAQRSSFRCMLLF